MRSDDIYWDLSLGGTVKLSTAWGKANLLVGEDGSDKIVAGYLVSSTNGAVIGAHNSALTDWAPLNVSGTYVNIRRNEITVAKFLDGCLSLFPLYNDYREGIRIHSYGSWSDILLCGNDNTGDTGTSANSWFIGNNNGTFNITRNGSSTGTAYLRCVDNKWYINTTTGGEQLNIGGWVGTVGNTGWYSITYGGGWYMTDSNFIRNCNSKAVSININSNNAWGIGSHRLAAVFKGNDHVSILLSTNTLGYGLCVNNNGNWYWGKRTSNSETSTSGDTYLLQGDTTLVRPSNNMAIGLGQIKASEFSSAYIRAVNARHLDASGVYSSDMDLYIGYGNNTPTQKTLFYYSTGTHGAAATSRTQFAEINSNGLYALTRFGVNGQNTSYNFYVNGTSYFNGQVTATQFNGYLNGEAARAARLDSYDTRSATRAPQDTPRGMTLNFKENGTYSLSDGGSYIGLLSWRSYGLGGDLSGGYPIEIAYTANGNLWTRMGTSTTAWGGWNKILTTGNYTGTLNGNYVRKAGDTMTGDLTAPNISVNQYLKVNAYSGYGTGWGGLWYDGNNKKLWVYSNTGNDAVFQASKVYGAVWNDYAEYRSTSTINPGQCVVETGLGDLVQSTKRLQPGANIVSDTFGFAIGETEQTKTPLAVSGRVLAYPYEDRYSYSAGDPVCSGPNGTISKMTRKEVREYPDRIVGTVSEIPEYETWGTGNVKVNGRIWIKVK